VCEGACVTFVALRHCLPRPGILECGIGASLRRILTVTFLLDEVHRFTRVLLAQSFLSPTFGFVLHVALAPDDRHGKKNHSNEK